MQGLAWVRGVPCLVGQFLLGMVRLVMVTQH